VTDLVEVHIVGMPLDVYGRSREYNDELFREFALIAADPAAAHSAPSRLMKLVDELTERFAVMTEAQRSELDDALERGDTSIDLVYLVPRELGEAAVHLMELMAETDEFCREGNLLTLVPTEEAIAVRTWFFEEFVRQTGGEPPRSFRQP